MAGFSSQSLNPDLDWSFSKEHCGDGQKHAGRILEFTAERQRKFQRDMAEIVGKVPREDLTEEDLAAAGSKDYDASAVIDRLARQEKINDDLDPDMAAAYSDLCGGSPAADVLLELLPRVRTAFYTYVRGLMSPT